MAGDQVPGVATICPDDLPPAKEQGEARQKRDGPFAVLHRGGGHADAQGQAQGVRQEVPLAPADPLARIVTNGRTALPGTFDALPVEDRRRGRWLAAVGDPHFHPPAVVEFHPQATFAPGREVIENGGLGRKVFGQHAPLASGAVAIEDGVANHPAGVLDGSPSGFWLGNECFEDVPFVVGEVAWIGLGWVHPKLDVEKS